MTTKRNMSIDKMQPVVKVMLMYLGVPLNEQPAGAVDRRKLLDALKKQDKERFDIAWKVIVDGVDPRTLNQKDAELIAAHEIGNRVRDIFRDYEVRGAKFIQEQLRTEISKYERDISNVLSVANGIIDGLEKNLSDRLEKAIKTEAQKFRKIEVKINNQKAKKIDGVVPAEFDDILDLAIMRRNIMLTGPAGCGKTFIAAKAAEALGLDFSSQSCSEGMSESALTGWLLPLGDSGKFQYVSSEFVRIYENGGVFLFDEMDAADPNVMVFMNQALANGGFALPQRYENPWVTKHKDFVAIAATNTFGSGSDAMYVGRNILDAATLDRFKVGTVVMNYDPTVEEAIIDEDVLIWGREVRDRISTHKMQRIMSTRVMLDATIMVRDRGWDIEKVKNNYYSDWKEAELAMMGGRV